MAETYINPKRINKDLPVPYYYQIVQVLRESIADLEEPDVNKRIALPSEPELSDLFSVNRGTIRHALQVLEREGPREREGNLCPKAQSGNGPFLSMFYY